MSELDAMVEKLAKEVLGQLFEQLPQIAAISPMAATGELLALSLIGDDPMSRSIAKVIDLDIVMILGDPMSRSKYDQVEDLFSKLCEQSSSHLPISVTHKIATGPVKPPKRATVNLLFHVLLFTKETYCNSPIKLIKNSWQYEGINLYGKELRTIQKIDNINLNDVIYGHSGIRYCRDWVESNSTELLVWSFENNHPTLAGHIYKLEDSSSILEMCFYATLRSASNALRYELGQTKNVGIGRESMELFRDQFSSFRGRSLPLEHLRNKERLRMGAWHPNDSEVQRVSRDTLMFLSTLEEYLVSN